jgi:mercuric ion transport protein
MRRAPHIPAMTREKLLKVGVIGTIGMGLCCFTPILVILLTTLGLSAIIGWLDFVLLPALAVFIAITGYALWMRQQPA